MDPKTAVELEIEPKNNQLGPQKVKNDPKINSKSNVRIDGNRKWKLLNYMIRPQNSFLPLPHPQK